MAHRMQWITRDVAGNYVIGTSRPLSLRPSQARLVNMCTDFCEFADKDVNDSSVSKARACANSLERLSDPDGPGMGQGSIEARAIRKTIEAVRARIADYERTAEEERQRPERQRIRREGGALRSCEAYARALLDLQRATAYLNTHPCPVIPDSLRGAPIAADSVDQVRLGRLAHDLTRACGAVGGLTAEGRANAMAYAEELAAILRERAGTASTSGD